LRHTFLILMHAYTHTYPFLTVIKDKQTHTYTHVHETIHLKRYHNTHTHIHEVSDISVVFFCVFFPNQVIFGDFDSTVKISLSSKSNGRLYDVMVKRHVPIRTWEHVRRCVLIFVCKHIPQLHALIFLCMLKCINIFDCMRKCIYICIYVCYLFVRACGFAYTCVASHASSNMTLYVYIRTHTHIGAFMFAQSSVSMYSSSKYIYRCIRTYMHTWYT
jgi:hypothetical protein